MYILLDEQWAIVFPFWLHCALMKIFLALIPGDPERKSSNNSIATAIIMTVSIE